MKKHIGCLVIVYSTSHRNICHFLVIHKLWPSNLLLHQVMSCKFGYLRVTNNQILYKSSAVKHTFKIFYKMSVLRLLLQTMITLFFLTRDFLCICLRCIIDIDTGKQVLYLLTQYTKTMGVTWQHLYRNLRNQFSRQCVPTFRLLIRVL